MMTVIANGLIFKDKKHQMTMIFPKTVISTGIHGVPAKCVKWRNLCGIMAFSITDSSTTHTPLALHMLRSE